MEGFAGSSADAEPYGSEDEVWRTPDADRGALDSVECVTEGEFVHALRREVGRSRRHGLPLACAFIGFGRSTAAREPRRRDSRLRPISAALLRANLRGEDTIGRFGGDELVLLLPHTDEAAAMKLADRLRATIAATTTGPEAEPLDARVGVAQWQPEAEPESLLVAAAAALFASQAAGGAAITPASALPPEHRPTRLWAAAPDAREVRAQDGVSMADVLAVLAELDGFGGASMELVAWELDVDPQIVAGYWDRARAERLISRFEPDPTLGEELWRLTSWGRRTARPAISSDE